jgi:hypothetical protein
MENGLFFDPESPDTQINADGKDNQDDIRKPTIFFAHLEYELNTDPYRYRDITDIPGHDRSDQPDE